MSEFLARLQRAIRPRGRRITLRPTRALVEIRGVTLDRFAALEVALQQAVADVPDVQWVQVHPTVARAAFAFAPGTVTEQQLVAWLERAERLVGADDHTDHALVLEHDVPDHDMLEVRRSIEVLAELGGLGLGLGLRLVPFTPTRLGVNAVAVLTALDVIPALRQRLNQKLGRERADFALSLGLSVANAIAERPMSSLVEIVHKATSLRQLRTRRRLWADQVDELCDTRMSTELAHVRHQERPTKLPPGPVELYTERATTIAASSASFTLMTTWSLRRATSALFAALPLPAMRGRELFCAALDSMLASRGALVLAPDMLLRLDRVDTLVIHSSLLSPAQFLIGEIVISDTADVEHDVDVARSWVERLFDPQHPLSTQTDAGYRLVPVQQLDATLLGDAQALAQPMVQRGSLALALTRRGALLAVAELRVEARHGLEDLASVARKAGLHLVVVSDGTSELHLEPADELAPTGELITDTLQRLQGAGRTVALVARCGEPALAVADCAIALRRGREADWNAHVLCADASTVALMIEATRTAADVSKQTVRMSMASAALGTVVSLGGSSRRASGRVLFVVNLTTLFAMAYGARRVTTLARRPVATPRDAVPWHALDTEAVLARLHTRPEGLLMAEWSRRRLKDGRASTDWDELITAVGDELFNPLAPLLAAGAGLSAVAGSTMDAAMVAGVGTINAMVGGYQRFVTERAINDLVRDADAPVRVHRDGGLQQVPADALVVGDVIELSAGERVPADLRILQARGVEVDASSLTGESLPVSKHARPSFEPHIADRASMLFAGTAIAAGEATAVVVALGSRTEAQRGTQAGSFTHDQGGIEERLRGLISITGPLVTAAGAGLLLTGLLRGRTLDEVLGSSVSLAVAAVPEGLPLLATAAQLSAARRLSEHGALVRNARCIEALGRVDVLCFDKTGTLTEGRIELRSVGDGTTQHDLDELPVHAQFVLSAALRVAAPLAADTGAIDPLDAALLDGGARTSITPTTYRDDWRAVQALPFESGRGFMGMLGTASGTTWITVKGAPEVMLARCTHRLHQGELQVLNDPSRAALLAEVERLADRGLRVLAVAERIDGEATTIDAGTIRGLTFLGLLAFSDPVRPSARGAVEQLRQAGVRAVMITGDHPTTAAAIARELDLGGTVLGGGQLAELDDEQLARRVGEVSIFARVTPAQKVRIVRALQRAGRVVAMAGDGANDVPALKAAHVGLAVGGRCTASARAAADIVLADARLEAIVEAIVEGRAMWSSVRDAVAILVGGNLGEIAFTLGAGLLSGRPPLSARQLLLVNFLTDVAPAMAIALRPPSPEARAELSRQPPGSALGPVLTREIFARALVTAGGAGGAWFVGRLTGSRSRANTMGLAALVGTQLGQTLTSGARSREVLYTGVGSAALLAAIIQTPGLSQVFGCRPIGPLAWLTVVGASGTATGLSVLAHRAVEEIEAWLAEITGEPIPDRPVAPRPQLPADAATSEGDPADTAEDAERALGRPTLPSTDW